MLKKFWYVFLVLLIEVSSLMAAELLGARLLVPFYGSSLYIWTAVLCITMLGLTLGYHSGRRLSVKHAIGKIMKPKVLLFSKINLYLLIHGLKLGSGLFLAGTGTQTRFNPFTLPGEKHKPIRKFLLPVKAVALALVLLFALSFTAMATIKTATTTGTWATGANWGGTAPVAGDTCVIPSGITMTVGTNTTVGAVTVLGGLRITTTGVILTVTGGSGTPLTYGTVGGNGLITSSGNTGVTNTIALTTGNWTFSGTFAGSRLNVTLNSTTTDQTISGALSCRVFTVAKSTTTLFLSITPTISNTTTLTSGNIDYNGGAQAILSASHPGNITTSGSGTKTLGTAIASVGGILTVKAGTTLSLTTLPLGATTAPTSVVMEIGTTGSVISGTGAGVLHLGGNVTINDITGSSGATISCPIALDGTRTFTVADDGTSANDLTISGVMRTANGVTKAGAGTMVLSGANTYTGLTTVSAGVLNIQNAQGTGTTGGGVTVTSGAALQLQGGITVGAEALTLNGTGISNDGALRSISGANIWGGTVTLGSASIIQSDAGSLTFNAANSITATNQNLTLQGAVGGTISGTITTGSGTLTKAGAGTWTLSGANTYTGGTTITAGALTLGAAGVLADGGIITLNGGTFSTGATSGYGETVGTLALTVNSTISLGSGSHTLAFANSSGITWTGTSLTINGWTGTAGSSGTAGKIFFGSGTGTLTAGQLAKISFTGYSGTPILLGTGELVPPGPVLAITGSPTNHGNSCIGIAATPVTYTITNTGATATGITVTSNNSQFVVSGAPTTVTGGGGTATYVVTFTPSGSGAQSATITVASTTTGSNSPTSSLTGTGNALPQGSLTANGPFCATGAGQLTWTASAGTGPYTVVYKENGGTNRTASSVASGTPFATYTTPVTITTTYTLVSVTDANTCVRSISFTGSTATITVNPLPQGSLTANGPFCVTGAGQLTWTASAGTGPYTVVYKENGGTDRTASSVASGTPFATYTTPVTITTTYTLVSVTDASTCVRSSSFTGGSATITVNALPTVTFTAQPGAGPVCAGVDVTYTTQASMTNYVWGFPGTVTTDYTITSGGTGTDNTVTLKYVTAGSKTVTINYTNTNGCTAASATSSTALTVNPATAISSQSTGAQTQCIGGTFTSISVTATGVALTYQWYSNTIASTTGGISLGSGNGAQTNSYTPQATIAGTLYYYCIVTGTCGSATSVISGAFVVNTTTAINSQSTGAQSQCIGGTFTSISVTATGVGLTYQWYSNTIASTTGGTSLGSGNGAQTNSYTPQATIAGTLYYYCIVTGTCGSATSVISGAFLVNPAIGNNSIDFTNGLHGTICGTAPEDGNAVLTAPSGTVFINVGFASYGTPTGTCPTFTLGGCHALTSQSVTEGYLLGNNTASIPAKNTVFGDPCVNTFKNLDVLATYTAPICSGNTPGTINGGLPTGGNGIFTYLWESSTTSSSSGFASATGTNNTRNYTPGVLTQTIWYRRTVTSGGCTNISTVIQITVTPIPTATISYAGTPFCTSVSSPQSVTLSGTGAYTGGTYSSTAGLTINSGTGAITPSTSTVGTYTVTYTIPASGGCTSVPVTTSVTINPTPAITAMTSTVCSGVGFTVTPVNGTNGIVPAGTTYSWAAPSGTGFSGGATGSGAANISGTLTNTTNTVATATYTVTPTSGSCTGATFTVTVTINPKPAITAMTSSVCSGVGFTVTPVNGTNGIVPAGTTYSWAAPSGTGFSGGTTGSGAANISGTLTNTTNTVATATYTVTPTSGSCTGATFTVTVTINPKPAITAMASSVCSGVGFTVTPVNGTNGIVPAGTTYSWAVPSVTGGITGGATGSGAANISGTLTNPTGTPQTATYTVTPTSGSCTGATFTVTVTVNPFPIATYTLTASPSTIYNGSSSTLSLSGSQTGVNYQLRIVTTPVGSAVAGTGSAISFAPVSPSSTTTYNVLATNATTGCSIQQTSTATVTVIATCITSQPSSVTICSGAGTSFSVVASGSPSYQWQVSTDNGGSWNNIVSNIVAVNQEPLYVGWLTSTLSLTAQAGVTLPDLPVATVPSINGYQYRCVLSVGCGQTSNPATLNLQIINISYTLSANPGLVDVSGSSTLTLSGSQVGVNYQLRRGSTPLGSPVAGTGSAISFATVNPTTSTQYNVLATTTSGGCSAQITDTKNVIVNETGIIISLLTCNGQPGLNFFTNSEFGTTTTNNYQIPDQALFPGVTLGWPLGAYTNYTYGFNSSNAIPDGNYVIANSTAGMYRTPQQVMSRDIWLFTYDRSLPLNNGTGDMYIDNASNAPGIFYTEILSNLCENTRYEFRSEMINLYDANWVPHGPDYLNYFPSDGQGNYYSILPNVDFMLDGKVALNTGNIMNDAAWKTFGFTFRTATGQDSVTLTMRNNSTGGIGNDIALDNIIMRACGPEISLIINTTLPVCPGIPVTMTAHLIASDYLTPEFQWQKSTDNGVTWNNISGANDSIYTSTNPAYGDEFRFIVAETTASLSNPNCSVASNPVSITTTAGITGTTPGSVCGTGTVTLGATANSGSTINWYANLTGGSSLGTGTSFTTPTISSTTTYYVEATNAGCMSNPRTSVVATVNTSVPVSVSILASTGNSICSGTNVTFTATPTNGGATPSYQWKLNGGNVGTNIATYSNNTLTNGNTISCVMTSSISGCITGSPATSNTITMTVGTSMPASVSISANPGNSICQGTSVTFTAVATNGGATPNYQWKKNTIDIYGEVSNVYTTTTLVQGDVITCVMTTSLACATGSPATSNTITMTVNTNLPASVSIAAVPSGAICTGTSVTFTATPTNGGTTPTYQWYNGASPIGGATNSTYTSTTLMNGAAITVHMTSNATCATGSPATSNTVTMTVYPTSVGGTVVSNQTICTGTSPADLHLSGNTGAVVKWQKSTNAGFSSPIDIAITSTTLSGATIGNLTVNTYFRAVVQSGVCSSANSAAVLVTVTPTVGTPTAITVSAGTEPTCQLTNGTTTTTYATTATNNTGFNWSLSNGSAGSIGATTGIMTWANGFSGTVNIQVIASGCNGPSSQVTRTVTVTPTVGAPVFTLGATSTRCQGAGTVTYMATATNNTGITYSLDATSLAGGNSIVAGTGAVTYVAGWNGTSIITASATGCNGPKTATHTVTITPTVGTPVFTLGATSTRCQGAGTVTYTATATNNTGITYSLDATSIAGGNSIVAGTGAVTYIAGWSGTSIITASAAGCNGPKTATHTVTITPTVGTPTAITISAGTEPTCQLTNGTTTTTYATTATNNTGFNWSLSNGSAGSIGATTGIMTWANSFSGSVDIRVTASGCNGPSSQVTRTVTITPTVGTPTAITISAGTEPTCQLTNGTTTTTYATTATNNTGFNWSLSNGSAGSIGATTGIMTWTNGFSGTVDIQVTASGCNGPSSQVTRTVNITPTVGTPTAITISTGTEPTCQLTNGTTTTTYATTATNNTGFNWSLSNGSAGSIDATTGVMTWADGFSGSVNIQVTASGCNGPSSQVIRTVTITPTIGTPTAITISAGTEPTCQLTNGTTTTTYATTTANNTGFNWSLSNGSAGSIGATTGIMTWANGFSGTVNIQVTASGCNGPSSQVTRTVTITSTVGTPTAITVSAGTEPTCQLTNGTTTTTYATTATNNTGYNWSLSNGSAGSIGATTGVMTWANGFTGSVNIQVTASGCNGPSVQVIRTVNVNPLPTASAGGSQAICSNATATVSGATSSNGTILWTHNGAGSITAGSTTLTPTYTAAAGDAGHAVTLTMTVTSNNACSPQTATATYTVDVNPLPTASAGGIQTICSNITATVSGASSSNGTILWTHNGAGSLSNATTLTPTYTPAIGDGGNTVTLTMTVTTIACASPITATATYSVNVKLEGSWSGSYITDHTDWNKTENWDCNQLPSLTSDVIIATGVTNNHPVLSSGSDGTCRNLTIQSGASVTVSGNTLQIAGTITNNGTFTATNGTIEMKGSSAQTIPASTFSTNTLLNLTVNNAAGVAIGGPLNITGILKAETGNLSSGENLTLVSTAAQTALIDGSGTGQVLGNVAMQRYLPSAFGYKYFSSPFQGATVNEFADDLDLTATFPTFYRYDEDNHIDTSGVPVYESGWVKYITPTDPLVPLQGYAANFGPVLAPKTADMTGVVNNGSFAPLSLMNHNRTNTKGFNLVGNPYPSPVDWDASSGWTRLNIDNAIYYFNAGDSSQYTGSYYSYINGFSSGGGASNIIPAMQSFFVHVSNGSYPVTGYLTFTNPVRINTLNPVFHKSTSEEIPLLRFTAGFEDSPGNEDAMVIYFNDAASWKFDKEYDALKLMNTDWQVPNIYSVSSDASKLSVNALPTLVDSINIIPVGLKTEKDGWITFHAREIKNFPPNLYIYFSDSRSGLCQNLLLNKDARINLKSGLYENRFSLIFSLKDFQYKPGADENFYAYSFEGTLYVFTRLEPGEKGTLSLYNILGQPVYHSDLFINGFQQIKTDLKPGIYVISLSSPKGRYLKKVFISNL